MCSMEKACDESAERLRRPVDIGQIHWSTANYFPWQEVRRVQQSALGTCPAEADVSSLSVSCGRVLSAFTSPGGVELSE